MDRNHIKSILEIARRGVDDDLPEVIAARKAANQDETLTAFLREEEQFDARVRAALTTRSAPEGLKDRIIKGAAFGKPADTHLVFPYWAQAAAIFILVGVLIFTFLPGSDPQQMGEPQVAAAGMVTPFRSLENFAARLLQSDGLEQQSYHSVADLREIKSYLKAQDLPEPHVIPPSLETPVNLAEAFDCTSLQYGEHTISLVSFVDPESRIPCYLFIAKLDEFPCLGRHAQVRERQYEHSAAAVWSCGQRVYLLVVKGTTDQLQLVMR